MSKLKKHVRNYTQVPNDIINDKRLSLKAKGLYLFLVSKPDNWDFSARLIAFQNNDQKASVNSSLHELESFGLLVRTPCQGGYDYELFDKIKVHFTENRLSRKSSTTLPKIDSVENRSSISNKEPLAKREEERENKSSSSQSIALLADTDFPHLGLFLDQISSARSVKNKSAYCASLRVALLTPLHTDHVKTLLAYCDFVANLSISSVKKLPSGVDVFDLYENM